MAKNKGGSYTPPTRAEIEAMRAEKMQLVPNGEAGRRERKLLEHYSAAQADLQWIVDNNAWHELGFDTFTDWYTARVRPAVAAAGLRPTQEFALYVLENVQADEAKLPKQQRLLQRELADLVGVSVSTLRRLFQDPPQASNGTGADLEDPAPGDVSAALTEAIRETAAQTSGAVPPASTEDASLALGEPDVDEQAASTSGTQDSPAADPLSDSSSHAGVPAVGGQTEERDEEEAAGDWVDQLSPAPTEGDTNPHGHCSTLSVEPCPTGVHFNPAGQVALVRQGYGEPAPAELWERSASGRTVKVVYLHSRTGAWVAADRVIDPPAAGVTSLPDGEGDPTPEPEQQPGHNSPTGQDSELPEGSAVATAGRSETDHHDGAGVSLSGEALPVESAGALLEDGDAAVTPSSSDYLMHLFASLVHGLSGLDAEALGPQLLGEEMELLHQHVDDVTHFVSQLGRSRFTEMTRTP